MSNVDPQHFPSNIRVFWQVFYVATFKVSEYPFKQNKNMLKNITMPLYANFYNILECAKATLFQYM